MMLAQQDFLFLTCSQTETFNALDILHKLTVKVLQTTEKDTKEWTAATKDI